MMLEDEFNTHDFLDHGNLKSRLVDPLPATLMRSVARLDYHAAPADHCDAGPRAIGDLENAPKVRAMLWNFWCRMLDEDLAGLNTHFHASKEAHRINVFRLKSGYSLDWHNHLASRVTATMLIYLFDCSAGQGGDLVLGELNRDMSSVTETQRFSLKHGDVVIMGDTTHPLLQHKADLWTGDGCRYMLSFAFNSEDW